MTAGTLERRAGRLSRRAVLSAGLATLTLMVAVVALGVGPLAIPPLRVIETLMHLAGADNAVSPTDLLVLGGVRLPRVFLAGLVGGALAVSGALLQGLFRNPLADPGLVGVSSGAALGAALVIVVGERFTGTGGVPFFALPFGAFGGGLLTTLVLYRLATRAGATSVPLLLLAGVALGAMAGALMGLLAYLSDDRQLRDLTFWSLGSLGSASWIKLAAVALLTGPVFVAAPLLARGLNALALGDAEAFHLGYAVERLKAGIILVVALAVGAAVAAAGPIGFVGIVVPHLLRLMGGADHRFILPGSAALGAALLMTADTAARTLAAPAELPVGILTAAIGAPFFLWLLLARRGAMP